MIQNKIDKQYTEAELNEIDAAFAVLERHYGDFPVLSTEDKQRLVKLPDGGGEFVESMTAKATQHAELMPAKYDPSLLFTDNTFSSQLSSRRERVETLGKRLSCAQLLVDSDRFATSLFIRRTLKANGQDEGLDAGLDEGIKRFLSRDGDHTPAPAPAK